MNDVTEQKEEELDLNKAPEVEVTDEEKEEFFKCFLKDIPYSSIVPIFNGKTTIELSAMTVQENIDISLALKNEQVVGLGLPTSSWLTELMCYKLAACLKKIDDKPFEAEYTPTENDPSYRYIEEKAKKLRTMSLFKLSALTEAMKQFELKVLTLTNNITDAKSNFWQADR